MKFLRNPETKGILFILFIALVLGTILAGMSGKLEQWGIPWFGGTRITNKIIFVSDRSGTREIYSMDLDGSNQQQLTQNARVLSPPAISPKGNKIAFVGFIGSSSQVYAIGATGGSPYPLTTSTGPKRQPQYSPDGKTLSYIERGRVFVTDLNGSNIEPVLPTEEEMIAARSDPTDRGAIPLYSAYAWGPDTGSMAGVSSKDRMSDALVYLPGGEGKLQTILPPKQNAKVLGLSFAAQKPLIAASVRYQGQDILITYDPENKQLNPVLGSGKMKLGAPAVSPNGSVIVVPVEITAREHRLSLVKIDLESRQAGPLATGRFERPVFSPNGDSILAAQYDAKAKNRSIVSIDAESGEVKQLASDGDCFDAIFSPMSEH